MQTTNIATRLKMKILARYKVVHLSHFKQSESKLFVANQWGIPFGLISFNFPFCSFSDTYLGGCVPIIAFVFLQIALITFLLFTVKKKNKVQKQLKGSEEKYRQMFNSLSVGFGLYELVLDDNGQPVDYIIRDANLQLLKARNMSFEDVINKRGSEVFEYCTDKWKEKIAKVALTGGVGKSIEYVHSQDKYYELHAYSPQLNFFAVIYNDITENEKAKADLLTQKSRIEGILKGTNAGTWDWDIQGSTFVVNARWAQIVGHTPEDLESATEATIFELVAQEDRKKVDETIARVFAKELDYFDLEFRMIQKGGQYVWVHSRSSIVEWDAEGKPLRMMGTCLDITDRKEVSIALAESEKRFKAIFDKSKTVMYIVDPQTTKMVDINNTGANFYGYSKESLLGISMDKINILSHDEIAHEMNLARLENKSVFKFKHRLASGHIRNVNVIASPLTVNNKDFLHCIVIDTTNAVEAAYKLKRINRRFVGINHIVHYKAASISDLLDFTLKESIEFTNSDFGAVYHCDSENGIFCLNNWSQNVNLTHPYQSYTQGLNNMDCLNKALRSKETVIENNPTQYYPFQTPESVNGDLFKSITLPVVVNNKVEALFWLATKNFSYSKFHVRQLMLLLDTAWIIVEKERMKG